jgi:glycerol-3-phosphate dehydrogenase
LQRLQDETFDVVVVGGGIVGAGIARDAALRGAAVALLERRDFGYGTSSRTSKLVHGGLRYLKQGRLRLVAEAARERDLLRRLEPRLVRPVRFYLPVYAQRGPGPRLTRLGLWVYRRLARDRGLDEGGWLTPDRLRREEPAIRIQGLRGGGTFHDCVVRDARLVLEVVKAAVRAGAAAANYLAVEGFEKEKGRLVAARVRDVISDAAFAVGGRVFVNAAGPWADAVRVLDDPAARPILRPTRGIHILVPRDRLAHEHALVLASIRDGRVVFVLPWGGYALVGTTDTNHRGDADEVRATADDVSYLLETVNAHFPQARLTPKDVVATYAGLRPLVGRRRSKESDISRAHKVFVSPSGLLTVAGGKLTTFRAMAEDVVDRVERRLARQGRKTGKPCRTRREPLRRDPLDTETFLAKLRGLGLEDDTARHLAATYLSTEMLPLLRDPALRERLVSGLPYVVAEVVHATRSEFARTVEDVLARRTMILYEAPRHGEECLETVVDRMADELGWDEGERDRQRKAYAAAVARMFAFREEGHD